MSADIVPAVIAAATSLGTEIIKDTASEASKTLWASVLNLLGFNKTPDESDLEKQVGNAVKADPELAKKLMEFLQKEDPKRLEGQFVADQQYFNYGHTDTVNMAGTITTHIYDRPKSTE